MQVLAYTLYKDVMSASCRQARGIPPADYGDISRSGEEHNTCANLRPVALLLEVLELGPVATSGVSPREESESEASAESSVWLCRNADSFSSSMKTGCQPLLATWRTSSRTVFSRNSCVCSSSTALACGRSATSSEVGWPRYAPRSSLSYSWQWRKLSPPVSTALGP